MFCSFTLNQSLSVPYRYRNKLPISRLKFVPYAYDNHRGANGYISQGKRLRYSDLQGIWALVQNKGCISFSYAVCIYIHMLNVDRNSKD